MDQILSIRAIPEVARSPPGSVLFTFVLQSTMLSSNCVHCDSIIDLFCTLDIYCMSVRPERGIPPLLLLLRFLPFFVPVKGFFIIRVEGLRTEGVICGTDCKAP